MVEEIYLKIDCRYNEDVYKIVRKLEKTGDQVDVNGLLSGTEQEIKTLAGIPQASIIYCFKEGTPGDNPTGILGSNQAFYLSSTLKNTEEEGENIVHHRELNVLVRLHVEPNHIQGLHLGA